MKKNEWPAQGYFNNIMYVLFLMNESPTALRPVVRTSWESILSPILFSILHVVILLLFSSRRFVFICMYKTHPPIAFTCTPQVTKYLFTKYMAAFSNLHPRLRLFMMFTRIKCVRSRRKISRPISKFQKYLDDLIFWNLNNK